MKKLDAAGLFNLKFGEKVYRISGRNERQLRFVSVMPSSKNYLIFEDGEYLTHLFINPKNGSFKDSWYSGEYDFKFIGELKLDYLLQEIENVKDVYLNP